MAFHPVYSDLQLGSSCFEVEETENTSSICARNPPCRKLLLTFVDSNPEVIAQIRSKCEEAGPIRKFKIVPQRGYGFVRFAWINSAAHAITLLNRKPFGNKILKAVFCVPEDKRDSLMTDYVFVAANLPRGILLSDITSILPGPFDDIRYIRHCHMKEPSIVIVCCLSEADCERRKASILQAIPECVFEHKLSHDPPKIRDVINPTALTARNFGITENAAQLVMIFGGTGRVTNVEISKPGTQLGGGEAVITFRTATHLHDAFMCLQNFKPPGKPYSIQLERIKD